VIAGEVLELGRKPVIARGALVGTAGTAVQRRQARSGDNRDLDALVHKRTRQQRNNLRAGFAVLGMARVSHAAQGAGMFYQNMLKAPSSADQRNASLARRLDRTVDRFGVVVG
jgi:cytochrome c-type biogenesis protein CcmH/NrfG